ncbi:MAG: ATP-binding protein, partial [Cyanobacteria bacterium J06559_3]
MAVAESLKEQWYGENHRYLMGLIAQVQGLLEQRLESSVEDAQPPPIQASPFPESLPPPALARVCDRFQLSLFERNVLLLCAAAALSRNVGRLCAALHGHEQQTYPSFGIALMLFPKGYWEALTPTAPLRRWRLVELMPGSELTHSPLRIDERILHELMGVATLDERLQGTVQPLVDKGSISLPPSYQHLADQIVRLGGWETGRSSPVVQLCGFDLVTKRAIAIAAAAQA